MGRLRADCSRPTQRSGRSAPKAPSPLSFPLGVIDYRATLGEEAMHIDGACHCGRISFTAEVDPTRVMICHCADCQVLSGSPFRAVVAVPIESFAVRGEPKSYVKVAESGNRRSQVFCPECGTPLYATAPENPTSVMIRLGCVKQRAELTPAAQIWQQSAMPWLARLNGIPGSERQQAFLPAQPVSKP